MKKENLYIEVIKEIDLLIDNKISCIGNLSNVISLIQNKFNFWWIGFYLINNKNLLELTIFNGPFACTLIDYGKGVCGKSWELKQSIIVKNVHHFEGHIACSSESLSEIVIPIFDKENVIGVLDVDSQFENHFDEIDKDFLIKITEKLNFLLIDLHRYIIPLEHS